MLTYFSDEPLIRTMTADASGLSEYSILVATAMSGNAISNSSVMHSGTVYAPDGNEDVDFQPLLQSMLSDQERNISTLQFWNSQGQGITQNWDAFNTYFTIADGSTSLDYSLLYDTRSLTTIESGCTNAWHGPSAYGYPANLFPDTELLDGQYFSLMYRKPDNSGEELPLTLGFEYIVDVPQDNLSVQGQAVVDSSLKDISFRYSGTADWQEWHSLTETSGILRRIRFYVVDVKETKSYVSPWLTSRLCDDPDTVYLYWVNSLGGIDFIRGKAVTAVHHDSAWYETNQGIDDRKRFGERKYHELKWNSYEFHTSVVSDEHSPGVADICTARWVWLYRPDGTPYFWQSVKVNESEATVKKSWSNDTKVYNYTFQLEDSIKTKVF